MDGFLNYCRNSGHSGNSKNSSKNEISTFVNQNSNITFKYETKTRIVYETKDTRHNNDRIIRKRRGVVELILWSIATAFVKAAKAWLASFIIRCKISTNWCIVKLQSYANNYNYYYDPNLTVKENLKNLIPKLKAKYKKGFTNIKRDFENAKKAWEKIKAALS